MNLVIQEEALTLAALAEYAAIPIAFVVDRILEVRLIDGGLGGMSSRDTAVTDPYVQDYDEIEAAAPARWPERCDISNWGHPRGELHVKRAPAHGATGLLGDQGSDCRLARARAARAAALAVFPISPQTHAQPPPPRHGRPGEPRSPHSHWGRFQPLDRLSPGAGSGQALRRYPEHEYQAPEPACPDRLGR